MEAKISWHRYGTKLRHCHLMYIVTQNMWNKSLCSAIFCPGGAQACTLLLLSIDGTDRRTLDRYTDPAPHTMRAASILVLLYVEPIDLLKVDVAGVLRLYFWFITFAWICINYLYLFTVCHGYAIISFKFRDYHYRALWWTTAWHLHYDRRCYFDVRSKADISQLNLPQKK